MSVASGEDVAPPIVLSIGGRQWTFPSPSEGFEQSLIEDAGRDCEVTAGEAADLFMRGAVYREMLEIGISIEAIARALWVVLTDFKVSREAAEVVWRQGLPAHAVRALVDAVAEAKANEQAIPAKRVHTSCACHQYAQFRQGAADNHSAAPGVSMSGGHLGN